MPLPLPKPHTYPSPCTASAPLPPYPHTIPGVRLGTTPTIPPHHPRRPPRHHPHHTPTPSQASASAPPPPYPHTIPGVRLGTLLADNNFSTSWDSLNWLYIYPIILLARAVAIAVHYPLLKLSGTGCNWRSAVVMWWGGLRGSVGLALALAMYHTLYSRKMWGDGGSDVLGFGR